MSQVQIGSTSQLIQRCRVSKNHTGIMASVLKSLFPLFLLCIATTVAAQTFTQLNHFSGAANGSEPQDAPIQGLDGNLYGTTSGGGPAGGGTVFKMTPTGKLTTLHGFCTLANCADGNEPVGQLRLGTDGNFYGVTLGGGANDATVCFTAGCGTIFKISPQGAMTTLYDFCSQANCADGAEPTAGLVQGADGNFYGTSILGGANNSGTVFKLTPQGVFTTLYSFCSLANCADGEAPQGLIQAANGALYGVTFGNQSIGGTVFKISTKGVLGTLHTFCVSGDAPCPGGRQPVGVLVQASDTNLYGVTALGGANTSCTEGENGCGTIFRITTSGNFKTLYNFCSQAGCRDGSNPRGSLVQATDGKLYGTTFENGDTGLGTIFDVTVGGTFTTIYSINSKYPPAAGVVQAPTGLLYGMTTVGTQTPAEFGYIYRLNNSLTPFVEPVPTSGKKAASVFLLGAGFKGTTSVTFSGVAATFTVVSDTQITATVPAGASTGTVEVTTPGGVLSSNTPFTIP